jgi:integrase
MRGKPLKINIPHVVTDTDRHGNRRVYYRRKGKRKIRLWETPGTTEFSAELEQAKKNADTEPPAPGQIAPGSFRAACVDYFESAAFRILGKKTQATRRGLLENICRSTIETAGGQKIERGTLPFAKMMPAHVEAIRDEKLDLPSAANGRVKALRQLFKWLKKTRRLTNNPALEVEYFPEGDGWHTWTEDDVRQYWATHALGTTARLAIDLLLFTGTRRSDTVRLGPPMERQRFDAQGNPVEELHFTEKKGAESRVRKRKEGPKDRELPLLPVLRATIDATIPTGLETYLVTSFGKPFASDGFGNKMRDWCDAAGLPHCSAHGLRKAGATFAAENGATTLDLMALYGWDSMKEAERYTRKVNRRRMAKAAMHLIALPGNDQGPKVSHREPNRVSHRKKD